MAQGGHLVEDGVVTVSDKGTGQGTVISPLLANVYLHYSLDLWAEHWRRREATGDMIIVRYADDVVVGFEHESDARRFWDAMRERLQEFSLSLHPDKTRLIEFGRRAATDRKRRGLGKAGDLQFPGVHSRFAASHARGRFHAQAEDLDRDRMKAKLKDVSKASCDGGCIRSIPEQGKWLKQVVTGLLRLPRSADKLSAALVAFRAEIIANAGVRTLHADAVRRSARTWEPNDEAGG